MQGIFVKECKDCNEIRTLISLIDVKIQQLSKASLYNKKYLTDTKIDKRKLQDLIYYKQIAENLNWDSNYYYPEFTRQQVISKIKELTINVYKSGPSQCKPGLAPTTSTATDDYLLTEDGQLIIPE